MRECSWALGEKASHRRESVSLGLPMAQRDNESRRDFVRGRGGMAITGINTQNWMARNLDHLDINKFPYEEDIHRFRHTNQTNRRHGE